MENTNEKICPACGEKISDGAIFCIKCGTKINGDEVVVEQQTGTKNFFEKNKKKIIISLTGVVTVLLILFIVNSVQASNLKKELKRDWYRVEGEDGAYILCILDFSDDEIEYRLETGYKWMDTTIANYDYKVISGNKIKVLRYMNKWETINVEFNDDKSVMKVSPALTSIDNTELWINLD